MPFQPVAYDLDTPGKKWFLLSYYPPCRTYFLLMCLIALMTYCFDYNVTITTTHRYCEGYHACAITLAFLVLP